MPVQRYKWKYGRVALLSGLIGSPNMWFVFVPSRTHGIASQSQAADVRQGFGWRPECHRGDRDDEVIFQTCADIASRLVGFPKVIVTIRDRTSACRKMNI